MQQSSVELNSLRIGWSTRHPKISGLSRARLHIVASRDSRQRRSNTVTKIVCWDSPCLKSVSVTSWAGNTKGFLCCKKSFATMKRRHCKRSLRSCRISVAKSCFRSGALQLTPPVNVVPLQNHLVVKPRRPIALRSRLPLAFSVS